MADFSFSVSRAAASALCVLCTLGHAAAPVDAVPLPLPLSGPALAIADAAYEAYARGDYAAAEAGAREALRQRPDVARLKVLLRKAQAAQKHAAARARPLVQAARGRGVPDAQAAAPPLAPAPAVAAPSAAVAEPRAPDAPAPPSVPDPALAEAQAGYDAFARGAYAQAVAHAQEATRLKPDNRAWQQLLANARIALLVEQDRKPEARALFDAALADGTLAAMPLADVAYLAARTGNGDAAFDAFLQADAAGALPATSSQDAGFAALRAGHDAQAIAWFERAIDDAGALRLRMTPQLLFETRRAVAEVSRQGGVIASLSYRGAVSGQGLAPGTDSLQGGVETYWRPWGWRNGRYVELFARAFETLASRDGGATGGGTAQGAIGMRYKPFTDTNVVASLSRVFAPSGGRNDWLAQLAYSGGGGTDLRADASAWWTARVSAEAGRYLQGGQHYALAQADAGRSVRLDGPGGHWVLYPHAALAADYDSTAVESTSVGAGPGLGVRYWFREDTYNAPRSYVDVSLQYRWRVAGARRAEGVFLVTTLSY